MGRMSTEEHTNLLLAGQEAGLRTLTPAARGQLVLGLVKKYQPHFEMFSGFARFRTVAKWNLPDYKMGGLTDSSSYCISLFDEVKEEGEIKAWDWDTAYPERVQGRQVLLMFNGNVLELTWSYEQYVHKQGKFVGDPYKIYKRGEKESLVLPTRRQLGELFGPSRIFALHALLANKALERLQIVSRCLNNGISALRGGL